MTPTALDFQAFPHVADKILHYADWGALRQLGATCKTLRAKVGAMQAEHLILSSSHLALIVETPNGSIPGLTKISFARPDHMADEVARILPITRATKTVTIEGFVEPSIDLTLIAAAFPNLVNYRITTDQEDGGFTPYFPFACRNVIIFYNDGDGPNPHSMGDEDDYDEFDDDEDDEPLTVPKGHIPRIPDGVEKIVVNMKGNDIPVADFFNIFDFPKSVKDFVIVFPLYDALSPERGTFVSFVPHILVMDTAELIGTDAVYTLVGLDEAPQRFNMSAALRRHLGQCIYKGPKTKKQYIDELMGHVRIVTKAEYAKTTADVDLETIEHSYALLDGMEDFLEFCSSPNGRALAQLLLGGA